MRIFLLLSLLLCTNLYAGSNPKTYPQKKPQSPIQKPSHRQLPLDIQDEQRSTESTSRGRI